MSIIIIPLIIIILLVLINSLYVAAEFATVRARKTRVNQMAEEGQQLAKILLPMMEDSRALDIYVAACQIGITVSSLALGAYGQHTLASALTPSLMSWGHFAETAADSISVTVVLIGLTILQVVIGELLPKSIAIQYPEKTALAVVIPMQWSLLFFRPLIWFFNGSSNLILKLLNIELVSDHGQAHTPEEIELLITESHEGGLLDAAEQQLLRNAFRFRNLTARQVMVPRTRLVAAPINSTISELMRMACDAGLSRIPLYQTTIDNIVGFVHIKDLFKFHLKDKRDPLEALREVIHVPETLPIADVWTTFNTSGQYLAIVFDEYGGTAGLITFEDLIEEIFGELQDEFDDEVPHVSADKEGRFYLQSDLLVTDVNEYLDLDLPSGETDTLGGLVFSQLGRPPENGDEIAVGPSGTLLRVEVVNGQRIVEVSLQLPSDTATPIGDAASKLGEWEVASHD